jgi:hypothetical protein
MSTQKDNPFLKQLIANISSNASTGRVTNIGWQSSGKVSLREGNMAPKKPKQDNEITKQADEMPADDVGPVGAANPKGNPDLLPQMPKPNSHLPKMVSQARLIVKQEQKTILVQTSAQILMAIRVRMMKVMKRMWIKRMQKR